MISEASVTVVIINWNSGGLLTECLACLSAQSRTPTRILVIDNGSSDDSARNIQQLPGVTVRLLGRNLGFAAANNLALAECDTEFVALLNPDAFPEKDWLMGLVEAAIAQPSVSAFGSHQIVHGSSDHLDGIGDAYHISGLVWRIGYGCMQAEIGHLNTKIFSPCAAAALYRRQTLVDVKGFDEDFFCYVEDVDLGFRLRLAGYNVAYVPNAVVHHVGSATTGGQHSDFAVYHGHRNLVWTYVKNMPGALFWLFLPIHILLNVATVPIFVWRGQGKVILRSKWDAINGLSLVWEKRKQIQAHRVATVRDIWNALDKRMNLFRRVC